MARLRPLLAVLALLLAAPAPARAQLGAVEAFARRVSDFSFYFSLSDVTGGSAVESEPGGTTAFGVELLFEVAEISRPIPGAVAEERADSVERVWTGMEVIRSAGRVDTVYTYAVEPVPPPEPPTEALWVMEIGLGYGQLSGYELEAPTLDMNVAIRDLPSVSLYASYEPWGNYFGLRTGFMRTQALQVADVEGATWSGEGEAFLFGGLAGYAFSLEDLWFFLETGYTVRNFPSVEWSGPGPLPAGVPRELDLSGWFLSTGVQLPLR